MSVKLIAENILTADDFLSATEQEGKYIGQPVPDSANTGAFRLLSKGDENGDIADFTYLGTATNNGSTTTIIDSVLCAFGDDYFIDGTIIFHPGWALVKDLSNEVPSQTQVLSLARITDLICLAGTASDGQIWRSTDAGATWALVKDLSNEVPSQTQVLSLARITDLICLAGTYPDGQIWRSTDAGATWVLVKDLSNEAPSQTQVLSLARITDLICLAGTASDGQIWRSTDAGATWALVKDLSNEAPSQTYVYSLARITDTICLAGTRPNSQIWRSTDAGATWALVKDLSNEVPSQTYVRSLACITDLICLAGTYPDGQIWRSTDAGATWALVKDLSNEVPSQTQVLSLARITDLICLAGTASDGQIWRSTDAGATWALVKDLSNEVPSQIHVFSLARITDLICLAGTYPDGQIWRSINSDISDNKTITDFAQNTGTLTWVGAIVSTVTGDMFTLIVSYATRDFRVELITSGDAGDATFKWSHNGGTTYLGRDDPNQADWLAENEIYNDAVFYAAITQASNGDIVCVYRDNTGDTIYKIISTDLGLTWGAPSQIEATGGINPHALITLSTGRLYLLLGSTAMYSDDNGNTWSSKFSIGINLKDVIELPNGNLIGTNDAGNNIYVVISSDGGSTFSTIITVTTAANDQQHGALVVAENGDMVCIYDTDEDGVGLTELKCKISSNGGATWGSTIDVINYPGQVVQYPTAVRDIDGTIIIAAQEVTADQKIVFTYSTDNGATWAAKTDLKSTVGVDLQYPELCLVDGHQMFCLYNDNTNRNAYFVRRGMWKVYIGPAHACPCAIEAIPQHLICDVYIIWHGGAGEAGDDWQFEAEYDFAMDNIISDSPSKFWRSEQDNIACRIVIDMGANERFLVDGAGFFNCNVRTLSFQANTTDTWGAPLVNESVSFDLVTGIVDYITGNAIEDDSLLGNYDDHHFKTDNYYLRMTSGTDDGETWKILDNVGGYVFLDTTAAVGIAADDTFVIFQGWTAKSFAFLSTWALVKDLSDEVPSQTHVYSLARITDLICLAGTRPDGQIWRSTDAGATWALVKDLSDEVLSQTQVLSLARITDLICLAGTYPDGQIWRSTNAGATWALVKDLSDEVPSQTRVYSLARITDTICLAGTYDDGQIWRSTDAGATWALVKDLSDEVLSQTYVHSLARITDLICLAGTASDGQIWRSTDAGATWALVKDLSDEVLSQTQVLSLARITDLICLAGTYPDGQIWRSTDAGATWALVKDLSDEVPSQTWVYSLACITDTICLAGTNPDGQIWRSTDAGATWALVKDLSDEVPSQTWVYSLACITDTICLAGTNPDGQIWRSTNAGAACVPYRFLSIYISAQETAEGYHKIGFTPIGKTVTLDRRWTGGYGNPHVYNIDLLQTPQGGLIPIKHAERHREFELTWPFSENTRKQLVALLDYLDRKNICLIPDDSTDNKNSGGCFIECYLVKLIGGLQQTGGFDKRLDIKLRFREIL